jgi:hypothetical protein
MLENRNIGRSTDYLSRIVIRRVARAAIPREIEATEQGRVPAASDDNDMTVAPNGSSVPSTSDGWTRHPPVGDEKPKT